MIQPGNETLAVIENWEGPIPQKGDYIFYPYADTNEAGSVISVKCVIYHMMDRPNAADTFVKAADPWIEIDV